MRFIIAQRRLVMPGGSETFVLTIAEQLARLGHEVVVQAIDLGLMATVAGERAINVIEGFTNLPDETDATIALDRVMAIDLARRYPDARRLYVMHNTDEPWLPPPQPGVVAATIAPNDRLELRARGSAGAGEVVRMKQPIDMYRFGVRGWARARPERILVLSNYLQELSQRVSQLQQAWSRPGLEWRLLGGPQPTTAVAEEMAKADIVVGYGRSILEAMACGRPAYIHDHSGSDGWVTAESYARMEADGFAGTSARRTPDLDQLRADFECYDPALGRVGQDLIRMHHDAGAVTAAIVVLIERLGRPAYRQDPMALYALRNLAESQLRTELRAEGYRSEAKLLAQSGRAEIARLSEYMRREGVRHEEEKERLRAELRQITAEFNRNSDFEKIKKAKTQSVYKSPGNLISQNQNHRRNEACSCGSGKKYKHCHGRF
jgi:hypothetical protein